MLSSNYSVVETAHWQVPQAPWLPYGQLAQLWKPRSISFHELPINYKRCWLSIFAACAICKHFHQNWKKTSPPCGRTMVVQRFVAKLLLGQTQDIQSMVLCCVRVLYCETFCSFVSGVYIYIHGKPPARGTRWYEYDLEKDNAAWKIRSWQEHQWISNVHVIVGRILATSLPPASC
jgi:hypothetical protein